MLGESFTVSTASPSNPALPCWVRPVECPFNVFVLYVVRTGSLFCLYDQWL